MRGWVTYRESHVEPVNKVKWIGWGFHFILKRELKSFY